MQSKPSSYIDNERQWRAGDEIQLSLSMPLRTEAQPDKADQIALLYGPLVLAAKVDEAASQRTVLVPTDRAALLKSIIPTGEPGHFKTHGLAKPEEIEFRPFFEIQESYAVYFDVFDKERWAKAESAYRETLQRQAEVDARTIDKFVIGEMQPERDHALTSEKSRAGKNFGGKWRDAFDGGWFEFDLLVDPTKPVELVCTYWGGDTYQREFDVIVDVQKIATQSLTGEHPGTFFDVTHPLPEELTRGKEKVRVRFQTHPGKDAGGLYGSRTVRPAASEH